MERGVRLFAVEGRRWIGREEIRIAWDEIIAAVPSVDVGVESKVARARVEQRAAFDAAVDRGRRAEELRLPAAGRGGQGNAVVGRFHRATHRLRAVAQRLRATIDLDLLDRQRIKRHAVVLPVVGNVHRAEAVLLHAHAKIVEPAQYRPRCAGREAGRGRAGHGEEQVAEALRLARLNLVAGDGAQRRRRLER